MSIEERITRLERANRRWRLAAYGLGVLCALVVVSHRHDSSVPFPPTAEAQERNVASPIVNSIRARRIEIVDESGSPCITMGVQEGDPCLHVFEKQERITLAISEGFGPMVFVGSNNNPMVSIGRVKHSGGSVKVWNPLRNVVAHIFADGNRGRVFVSNQQGELRDVMTGVK